MAWDENRPLCLDINNIFAFTTRGCHVFLLLSVAWKRVWLEPRCRRPDRGLAWASRGPSRSPATLMSVRFADHLRCRCDLPALCAGGHDLIQSLTLTIYLPRR